MNIKTAREKIREIEKHLTKAHRIFVNEMYCPHDNFEKVMQYILSGQIRASQTVLYWCSASVLNHIPFKQFISIQLRKNAPGFDMTLKDSDYVKDSLSVNEYILSNLIAYGASRNKGYRKGLLAGKKYLVADLVAKIKKTVHAS